MKTWGSTPDALSPHNFLGDMAKKDAASAEFSSRAGWGGLFCIVAPVLARGGGHAVAPEPIAFLQSSDNHWNEVLWD